MSCTSAPRSKWATSSSEWDLVASSPTSEHFYSGFLSILTLAVTAPPGLGGPGPELREEKRQTDGDRRGVRRGGVARTLGARLRGGGNPPAEERLSGVATVVRLDPPDGGDRVLASVRQFRVEVSWCPYEVGPADPCGRQTRGLQSGDPDQSLVRAARLCLCHPDRLTTAGSICIKRLGSRG